MHPRRELEGFVRRGIEENRLEAHGIEHWTHFYTDSARRAAEALFAYYLKGEKNGWTVQPRCSSR